MFLFPTPACKALADELAYDIKKIGPKRTVNSGTFRLNPDGTRGKKKVRGGDMEVRNNCQHVQLPTTYPNSGWSLNLLTFSLVRPAASKLLLFPLGAKVIYELEIEVFFPGPFIFGGGLLNVERVVLFHC